MTAAAALTCAGCSASPGDAPSTVADVSSADPAAEEKVAGAAVVSVASVISELTGTAWTDSEDDIREVVACSKADAAVHRSTRPYAQTVGTALPADQFDQVLDGASRALAAHGYAKQVIAARYPNVLDAVWRNTQGALIRLDSSKVLTVSATSSCWPDAAYGGGQAQP